jgi:HNH endonuclease
LASAGSGEQAAMSVTVPLPPELVDVADDDLRNRISSRIRAPLDGIGKLEVTIDHDGKSEPIKVDDDWLNKERKRITGITERALLRASHIKPWADCTDGEHLDVHNGLLLSALWDAAFDRGLVSFADDGSVLVSPRLGEREHEALGLANVLALQGLRAAHRVNLALHRNLHGFRVLLPRNILPPRQWSTT